MAGNIIITPHENDVLFGRGSNISAHPGNQRLRSVTQTHRQAFFAAKKLEKRNIAVRIVDEIGSLDPPGRFLVEDLTRGNGGHFFLGRTWPPVGADKAVTKVMHLLREKEKPPKKSAEQGPSIANNAALQGAADAPLTDFPQPQPLSSYSNDMTTNMPNIQQSINGDILRVGGLSIDHGCYRQHTDLNEDIGADDGQNVRRVGKEQCLNQLTEPNNPQHVSDQHLHADIIQRTGEQIDESQSKGLEAKEVGFQSGCSLEVSGMNFTQPDSRPSSFLSKSSTTVGSQITDDLTKSTHGACSFRLRHDSSPTLHSIDQGSVANDKGKSEIQSDHEQKRPIISTPLIDQFLSTGTNSPHDRKVSQEEPASKNPTKPSSNSPSFDRAEVILENDDGSDALLEIDQFLSTGGTSPQSQEVSKKMPANKTPPVDCAEAVSEDNDDFDALVSFVFDDPPTTGQRQRPLNLNLSCRGLRFDNGLGESIRS
ncbi:hypothetical protein ACHAWF_002948 [Thalassiosira exigua]